MTQLLRVPSHGQDYSVNAPNKCPLCHHIVLIDKMTFAVSHQDWMEVLYHCPNTECDRLFICHYKIDEKGRKLILEWIQPTEVELAGIPDKVSEISPDFVAIYREAEKAKQSGLLQICGAGFRKAFEFLIKDYAKHLTPNEKERKEINETFSGNVVDKYIADSRVQKVAKRALWLGNDETHYLRKWTQHDVQDLIILIHLTLHWVEMEQLSGKYEEEMPDEQAKGT